MLVETLHTFTVGFLFAHMFAALERSTLLFPFSGFLFHSHGLHFFFPNGEGVCRDYSVVLLVKQGLPNHLTIFYDYTARSARINERIRTRLASLSFAKSGLVFIRCCYCSGLEDVREKRRPRVLVICLTTRFFLRFFFFFFSFLG
jgi:hypothetical protein